jgi:hypothetical protein
MTKATKKVGTTPTTVRKYASSALGSTHKGRVRVRPSDRLVREMRFLTPEGQIEVRVHDAREASAIGAYFDAVDDAVRLQDASRLAPFEGQAIHDGRRRRVFLTDLETLTRLAHVGEVRFEDIYQLST